MAGTATPIFPQTLAPVVKRIQNSDTTTKVTLVTAAANGTRVQMVHITSTETGAKTINFYITESAVDYLVNTINIPANSGNTTSAPPVWPRATSQFTSLDVDSHGNRFFTLKSGQVLKAAVTVTMTSGKFMDFFISAGDY